MSPPVFLTGTQTLCSTLSLVAQRASGDTALYAAARLFFPC